MKFLSTISILLATTTVAVSGASLTNDKSNAKDNDMSKWVGKASKNCMKECFKDDTYDGDCNEKCDFTDKSKSFNLCLKDAIDKYQTNSKLCRQAKKQKDPLIIEEEIVYIPANGNVRVGDIYRNEVAPVVQTGTLTKSYQFGTTHETCKDQVKDVFEVERKSCQSIHTISKSTTVNKKVQISEDTYLMGLAEGELIRGFYDKTYDTGITPPSDTNVMVSFCGAFPNNPTYPTCSDGPINKAANNWASYGGGNDAGSWSDANIESVIGFIPTITTLGYTGVVLDIEQSSEVISIARWNELYSAIKDANLVLCVTTSHFQPYGILENAAELVSDWLQSTLIDYLSPQLYTSGNQKANSWQDFNSAYKTSVPKVIPSIVQSTYYATVPVTVTSQLPNAVGYIQWQNPTAPPPTPKGGCVSSTFSGVGCYDMCSWCEGALGTDQIYWESGVCAYDTSLGHCNGTPQAGVVYTCCQIGS